MYKLARTYVTICWIFFIFKLLTLPMPPEQNAGLQTTLADKLVHFFIFGLLTYFLAKTLELFIERRHRTILLLSLLMPAIYGLLLEYLQSTIPGRSASLFDSAAGLSGSLFALWLYHELKGLNKPRLLLHVCCIGCGAYVSRLLSDDFRVALYYYNPNIHPEAEYQKRLLETRLVAKRFGFKIFEGAYDHQDWLQKIKGHEHVPERGSRCLICYRERLEAAAKLAQEKGYVWFASTLTVSPHKLAGDINRIGTELETTHGVRFLNRDFKKSDGFKKSLELSRELELYRQDYCGCEFSLRRAPREGSDNTQASPAADRFAV